MDQKQGLFGNTKYCEFCGKPLPDSYKENLCPACLDHQLFHDVKEYIRSHECNEYEVAEEFHIPLSRVKAWIRDGRIEYKKTSDPGITGMYCQKCGATVTFGTLCPKCLKQLNSARGHAVPDANATQMHYLDVNDTRIG